MAKRILIDLNSQKLRYQNSTFSACTVIEDRNVEGDGLRWSNRTMAIISTNPLVTKAAVNYTIPTIPRTVIQVGFELIHTTRGTVESSIVIGNVVHLWNEQPILHCDDLCGDRSRDVLPNMKVKDLTTLRLQTEQFLVHIGVNAYNPSGNYLRIGIWTE